MIQIRDPETYLNTSNGLLNLPSPPSLKLFPTSLVALFYRKSILSCPLWLDDFCSHSVILFHCHPFTMEEIWGLSFLFYGFWSKCETQEWWRAWPTFSWCLRMRLRSVPTTLLHCYCLWFHIYFKRTRFWETWVTQYSWSCLCLQHTHFFPSSFHLYVHLTFTWQVQQRGDSREISMGKIGHLWVESYLASNIEGPVISSIGLQKLSLNTVI